MVENVYCFKTMSSIYEKERNDIKNNTVREIDLNDSRFTELIYWMYKGFDNGEPYIRIQNAFDSKESFQRSIKDITIWMDLMIITWHPKVTL